MFWKSPNFDLILDLSSTSANTNELALLFQYFHGGLYKLAEWFDKYENDMNDIAWKFCIYKALKNEILELALHMDDS